MVTIRGPTLVRARQVGHFAVLRTPDGTLLVQGAETEPVLPWMVVHVASGALILDFEAEAAAWRFADEISIACGERIDDEPATAREFSVAVPDVVRWVHALDVAELVDGERVVTRYRDWRCG